MSTFGSGVQLMVTGMADPSVVRIDRKVRARPLDLVREARGCARLGCGDADAQSPVAGEDSLANGQSVSLLLPS